MMVSSVDGQLIATAPGSRKVFADDRFGTEPGRLIVFDTRDLRQKIANHQPLTRIEQVIEVGEEPYGISATSHATKIIFTNRRSDSRDDSSGNFDTGGVGLLERSAGARTYNTPKYIELTLGSATDAFDVNNAQAVVVTRDLKYAFVTGYNQFIQGVPSRDPDISLFNPAGGNIGIIKDPFGPNAKLVAATRMTPYSFPDNLVLSPGEEYLYAAYSGVNQIQVFGVSAMLDDLERILAMTDGARQLTRTPINEFLDTYTPTGQIVSGLPLIPNPLIDLKADFRLRNFAGVREFGNFIALDRAPLVAGSQPRGLAVQDDFLTLVGPTSRSSTTDQTPTFTWTLNGREATTRLFVSVYGPGQGLFPEDPPPSLGSTNGSATSFGPDANRNRIYTGDEIFAAGGTGNLTFDLPNERVLTRGQTYWWGVEAVTADGRVHRKAQQFKVSPVVVDTTTGPADHFPAVTLITHGWQLPYVSSGSAAVDVKDILQLGAMIAKQGDGMLFIYDPGYGKWFTPERVELTAATAGLGKPLVLISDWTAEAPISDSGFSEAAADAIFASLVDLFGEPVIGDALLDSPWHLIGFSRGASVTSEIVQRLGTYYPTGQAGGLQELQVTMLDPHDFEQASLKVPLATIIGWVGTPFGAIPALGTYLSKFFDAVGKYATFTGNKEVTYDDFKDPDMLNWANVGFLDNYFQEVSGRSGALNSLTVNSFLNAYRLFDGFTPNGRRIDGADINLSLTDRPGFTIDDRVIGLGTTHMRVKSWYAGTADLGLEVFPAPENSLLVSDRIWRRVADRSFQPDGPYGLLRPILSGYEDKAFPWYRSRETENAGYLVPYTEVFARSDVDRSWEGIGEGWFYTILGGGDAFRPQSSQPLTPVTTDNTEFGAFDGAVPTIFNGNFQASMHPLLGRFPIPFLTNNTWLEIPGWSLHGGSGSKLQGLALAGELKYDWADIVAKTLVDAGYGTVGGALTNEGKFAVEFIGDVANSFFKGIAKKLGDQLLAGNIPAVLDLAKDTFGVALSLVRDFDNPNGAAFVIDKFLEFTGAKPAIGAGFKEALRGAAVDAVIEAVLGLLKYVQANLLDYSYILTVANDTLTHNRMLVPDQANTLRFDYKTSDWQAGAIVEAYMTLSDGTDVPLLGTFSLPDTGGEFVQGSFLVPNSVQGKAATLTFHLTGSTLLGPELWIDNVQFDGLLITDSSGAGDDNLLFFTDDTDTSPDFVIVPADGVVLPSGAPVDPANGPTPPPSAAPVVPDPISYVDARNRHTLTLKNPSSQAITVTVKVIENAFLVQVDSSDNVIRTLNDGHAYTWTESIGGNSEITLRFQSVLRDGYLAASGGSYDALLLNAGVVVQSQTAGVASPLGISKRLDMFYLADVGDGERDNGYLDLPETLEGRSRTLRIRNASGVDISAPPAAAPANADFIVSKNGSESRVTFLTTPTGSAQEYDGVLTFKFGGRELGDFAVVARMTPAQVVWLPMASIVADVTQLITQLRNVEAGAAPGPGDIDPTPTLLEYARALDIFDAAPSMSVAMSEFERGLLEGFRAVYSRFVIGPGAIGNAGSGALVVSMASSPGATDIRVAPTYSYLRQPVVDRGVTGDGELDFAVKGLFNPIQGGIIDRTTPFREPAGLSQRYRLVEDMTDASLRYRLDTRIDTQTNAAKQAILYIDAAMREASDQVLSLVRTTYDIGRVFANTIAHEVGHNLGLFDEYVMSAEYAALPQYGPGFSSGSFMGNRFSLSVTQDQNRLLALALNDPVAADEFWGFSSSSSNGIVRPTIQRTLEWMLLNAYNNPNLLRQVGASLDSGETPSSAADIPFGPGQPTQDIAAQVDFALGDTSRGTVEFDGTSFTLYEDSTVNSSLRRGLVVPTGAVGLAFDIVSAEFDAAGNGPLDAFEFALLDGNSFAPIGGIVNLTNSDAALNIQADGRIYKASSVTLRGLQGNTLPATFNGPITVFMNLTDAAWGESASLYFDLLGFGAQGSRVVIDNVRFLDALNTPPIAVDDAASAAEDGGPVLIDVLANDTDADNDPLSISVVQTSAAGAALTVFEGKIKYDPGMLFQGLNADETASDSFTYTIADPSGESAQATVTVTVSGVNDVPVGEDDTAATDEDHSVTISASTLLANDTDADFGDTLSVVAVSKTGVGSVSLVDGSIVYDPAGVFEWLKAGELATDTFSYTLRDGAGAESTANVTVTITGINDAPVTQDQSASTDEDASLSGRALASDVDNDSLIFNVLSGPSYGSLEFNADGSFTYMPYRDINGPDAFEFSAYDGALYSAAGRVSINVRPVNDAPVARDDAYATDEDFALVIAGQGVLGNDDDVEGDALSAILVAGPGHGVLTLDAFGSFHYMPNRDYNGTDSFTYRASDGNLESELATVSITVNAVNDPPVAEADTAEAVEDGPAFAIDVLANDTDVDANDTLTVVSINATGTFGTVTIDAGGTGVHYAVGTAFQNLRRGETATDSFRYTIRDTAGAQATATVTVTITGVNVAPQARDDAADAVEDGPPIAIDVLANDTDPDDVDTRTITMLDTTATAGTVTIDAGGLGVHYAVGNAFQYLRAGQTATDTFGYTIADADGATSSATATVTITGVNDAPEARNDAYSTDEDTVMVIAGPGVLGNDDDAEGDALSAILVTNPVHGSLAFGADGSFRYTPDRDFYGTDSFTYRASDGSLASDVATVSIIVNAINDAPVAQDQNLSTDEDTSMDGQAVATDVNSASPTYELVSGPAHGSLVFNADGTFRYVPVLDFNGNDSFRFIASDGMLSSDAATISIKVNAVNDAPNASSDAYETDEDTVLTIAGPGVLANDSDVDGDTLTAILTHAPLHGSLTLNPDGSFSYAPDRDFNGIDSFSYRASDGKLESDVATVSIRVRAANDAPQANADSASTDEDSAVLIDVLANDTDVDAGDTKTLVSVTGGAAGTAISMVGDRVLYDPGSAFQYLKAGELATDTFSYTMKDSAGAQGTATVTVTVLGANDAPKASADAAVTDEDHAVWINVLANDTDADAGDTMRIVAVSGGASGTFISLVGDTLVYDPGAAYQYLKVGETASDSFIYTIEDSAGARSNATVTVSIAGVNDAPRFVSNPVTSISIDASQVGSNLDAVFKATGGAHFEWVDARESKHDEYGIYRVDDVFGTVNGIFAGAENYAAAALSPGRAQIIYASGDRLRTDKDISLDPGAFYAFYMIRKGGSAEYLAAVAKHPGDAKKPLAYFSFAEANSDGRDHMRVWTEPGGALRVEWDWHKGGEHWDKHDGHDHGGSMRVSGLSLPMSRAYAYDADAIDVDGDTLTYSLLEAPAGASINAVTGVVSWLPQTTGTYRFVLRVQDTQGAFDDQSFELNVSRVERVLEVRGTNGNDHIDIYEHNGLIRVEINKEVRSYSGITSIHVDALGGNDRVRLFGLTVPTLVEGGDGNDKIDGRRVTVARLELDGGDGNDQIRGGANDDWLIGGAGNDVLRGGAGNDWIIGGEGKDKLSGGKGDDALIGGPGKNTLKGGKGDDVLVTGPGKDQVKGGSGVDRVMDEAAFASSGIVQGAPPVPEPSPDAQWIIFEGKTTKKTEKQGEIKETKTSEKKLDEPKAPVQAPLIDWNGTQAKGASWGIPFQRKEGMADTSDARSSKKI